MTTTSPPRATSGAWRDGDPVGRRQFVDLGAVELERGGVLPAVRVAYETWGELNAAGDNAILVEHALTGDSHVDGPTGPGSPDAGLVGRADRARSRRSTPTATSSWPPTSSAAARAAPARRRRAATAPRGAAGSRSSPCATRCRPRPCSPTPSASTAGALVLGGSMGGMRALEWAVTHPERVATAIVLASTAYATAEQIGWCQAQLLAIRADPHFHGGDYYERGDRARDRAGDRPADRPRHLPQRARAARALRSRAAAGARTRWAGAGATPSSPTSTTTPASWPGASTPTPTSSSPRR